MEKSKLILERYYKPYLKPKQIGFLLTDECMNDETRSLFYFDLLVALLNGHELFLCYETFVKTIPRKRFILPNKQLQYYTNYCVAKVKSYCALHGQDCQWHEEIVPRIEGNKSLPNKICYVYSKTLDPELIEINSQDDPEIWFRAFAKSQNISGIDKLISEPYESHIPAIVIHDDMMIETLPMYYPTEQLIDRIRTVAEKYNKILEVNI